MVSNLPIAICLSRVWVWFNDETLWGDVIKKYPSTAKAHADLGTFYYIRNRFKEAKEEYHKSVVADPRYAMGHNNLAAMHERDGEHEAALEHYTKAVALDERSEFFHLNFAKFLTNTGNVEKANEHYLVALQIRPDYAPALNNLVINFLNLGRTNEAKNLFMRLSTIAGYEKQAQSALQAVHEKETSSSKK